jgi:ABC-type nitrate/sulfonate/bicarbonate transport system substrate-binding protein
MRVGIIRTLAALVVVYLPAAGLAAAAGPPDPLPLNLGVMPSDGTSEGFYAFDQGFFKAAGLDVKLTVMNNGAALTSAMVAGDLDIAIASVGVVAMAHDHNLPMKFVAPSADYNGPPDATLLMVPKDSTVKTGADLNGQTVAINGLKDLTQFTTAAWIDKNGGNVSTIKFVEIPFSEMGVALQNHRVAAALMVEPFIEAAKPVARALVPGAAGAVAPHYLSMGWFSMDSWTQKNPETIRRFRIAIQKAAIWANAHRSESALILLRHSKLDPDVVKTMVRAHFDPSGSVDPAIVQPVIDTAAKYGSISKPFPAADIIAPN